MSIAWFDKSFTTFAKVDIDCNLGLGPANIQDKYTVSAKRMNLHITGNTLTKFDYDYILFMCWVEEPFNVDDYHDASIGKKVMFADESLWPYGIDISNADVTELIITLKPYILT